MNAEDRLYILEGEMLSLLQALETLPDQHPCRLYAIRSPVLPAQGYSTIVVASTTAVFGREVIEEYHDSIVRR